MADGLIAVRFLSFMLIWKLPNAAASQVSVTNAATTLPALIATAASAAFPIPDTVDTAVIVPENGQVRVMFDGNTPTASLGILLSSGVPYIITGVSLSQIRLISVSGSNVAVSVQVGQQNDDEQPLIAAGGSSGTPAILIPATPPTTLSSNLPVAQYNTTAPTATNSNVVAKQCDVNGNDLVRETYAPRAEDNVNDVIATVNKLLSEPTYAAALFTNYGANATLNVKATKGNVFAAYCKNKNASARYLQLHNLSTTPATNAVPVLSFPVPASGGSLTLGPEFFLSNGYHFNVGIAFAFSTDESTYQAGAAADQTTFIRFSA